jgi:hypothetical protein
MPRQTAIIPLPQTWPVKQKLGLVHDKRISSHPGRSALAAMPQLKAKAHGQLVTV